MLNFIQERPRYQAGNKISSITQYEKVWDTHLLNTASLLVRKDFSPYSHCYSIRFKNIEVRWCGFVNYKHFSLLFRGYKHQQLQGEVSSLKCSRFNWYKSSYLTQKLPSYFNCIGRLGAFQNRLIRACFQFSGNRYIYRVTISFTFSFSLLWPLVPIVFVIKAIVFELFGFLSFGVYFPVKT